MAWRSGNCPGLAQSKRTEHEVESGNDGDDAGGNPDKDKPVEKSAQEQGQKPDGSRKKETEEKEDSIHRTGNVNRRSQGQKQGWAGVDAGKETEH
ncbi:MAG: hypothetical protein ABIK44_07015 [candidate division WOR-3 bacterium]